MSTEAWALCSGGGDSTAAAVIAERSDEGFSGIIYIDTQTALPGALDHARLPDSEGDGMRDPDYGRQDEGLAWRVPLDRVADWLESHPELTHAASRDGVFRNVWRDLWYLWVWVAGGDIDDELARQEWFAVILRDLRNAPRNYPRAYKEAEWELVVERIGNRTPPVDGEGLHDQTDGEPWLLYQFHGLPEQRVLNLDGEGTSFAIYGIDLLLQGRRMNAESVYRLSQMVNLLREREELRPLLISEASRLDPLGGTGLLCELEDGSPTTPAVAA